MSSEQNVKQALESSFALYHLSFLDQIARKAGFSFRSKNKHAELANSLSNYERVRALYQGCSTEEQRELILCYLAGPQQKREIYFGFSFRKSGIKNEKAVLDLLRKGLLLMVPFSRRGKVNPSTDIRRSLSTFNLHPFVELLIKKEGFRWLPLNPIPEPERIHQISYRHREQDLYRLAERIQRQPLSMTNKELPNRQELSRVAKEFSLPKDVTEKLCLLGMATGLFHPTRTNLKVAKKGASFFKLTTEGRLQELGHSLPTFIELLRRLDIWFDTEPIALILRLLSLIPPGEWYDLQPLASWVKEQELLRYIPEAVQRDFSRTLEHTLPFMGWADLGYQGENLVAFRVTPFGSVALGSTDSLPPQSIKMEERLTVQPNFEILASIENLSLEDAGFLEKFATRTKADVVNVYQVNRNSLYQAAQERISLEGILKFIKTRSATGIPDNVLHSLWDWWADFQRIKTIEDADILEDGGGFSFVQGDIPDLPVLDYHNLPGRIASWEEGQIKIKGKPDLFALGSFKAIAKPVDKAFQLDPERLRSLKNCSNAYFTRLHHTLSRTLGNIPQELLITLRAYHGEFGQAKLTQLPVIIFPKQDIVQSLLQVSWFRDALVGWTGGLAILHPEKAPQVKEKLLSMGFDIGEGSIKDIAVVQKPAQTHPPLAPFTTSSAQQIEEELWNIGSILRKEIMNEASPERVGFSDHPVSLPSKQLRQVIEEAIEVGDDLSLLYYSSSRGATTQRQVTPQELYQDSGGWTLKGYCHLRNSERAFRLRNIQAIKVVPGEEGNSFEG